MLVTLPSEEHASNTAIGSSKMVEGDLLKVYMCRRHHRRWNHFGTVMYGRSSSGLRKRNVAARGRQGEI
jgi:hypothetical protein